MNTTFETLTAPVFQVIVMVNINGESYTVGKVMYDMNTWDGVKKRLTSSNSLHPSDEFLELLKNHFSDYDYINEIDLRKAYVEFIFVDNVATIKL